MYRLYGLALFVAGGGFLLVVAYLLFTEYMGGLVGMQNLLFPVGGCLFGYWLTIAGYRMSTGDRF